MVCTSSIPNPDPECLWYAGYSRVMSVSLCRIFAVSTVSTRPHFIIGVPNSAGLTPLSIARLKKLEEENRRLKKTQPGAPQHRNRPGRSRSNPPRGGFRRHSGPLLHAVPLEPYRRERIIETMIPCLALRCTVHGRTRPATAWSKLRSSTVSGPTLIPNTCSNASSTPTPLEKLEALLP